MHCSGCLQEHGIDTNDYPPEAISELCDELYEAGRLLFVFMCHGCFLSSFLNVDFSQKFSNCFEGVA